MDGRKSVARGLANVKFLTTHSLMRRNSFSWPEAVNSAGEIPRKERRREDRYLLHPETDSPQMPAGTGNDRL